MKTLLLTLTLAATAFTTSAFAQSAAPANTSAPAAAPAAAPMTVAQAGQWTAPYGQAIPEKTRGQVYRSLIHAEQDGQIAYLDKNVYAHH
jgi:hypothetical protein